MRAARLVRAAYLSGRHMKQLVLLVPVALFAASAAIAALLWFWKDGPYESSEREAAPKIPAEGVGGGNDPREETDL